jgi:hypothetical protein
VPNDERLFRLVALVIAGSIVAHSSTDVLLARGFVERRRRELAIRETEVEEA